MRIQYDPEADAIYIEIQHLEPGTAECGELSPEITADYGPNGRLAGIEILDASYVFVSDELKRVVFEIAPSATQ